MQKDMSMVANIIYNKKMVGKKEITGYKNYEELEEELDELGFSSYYREDIEGIYKEVERGEKDRIERAIKGADFTISYISGQQNDDGILLMVFKKVGEMEEYNEIRSDARNYSYLRDIMELDDIVSNGAKSIEVGEDNRLRVVYNVQKVYENVKPYLDEMERNLRLETEENEIVVEREKLIDYIKRVSSYEVDNKNNYADAQRIARLTKGLAKHKEELKGLRYKYITSYESKGVQYTDMLITIKGGYYCVGVYGIVKVDKEGLVEQEVFRRESSLTTVRDWSTSGGSLLIKELVKEGTKKEVAIVLGKCIVQSYDLRRTVK